MPGIEGIRIGSNYKKFEMKQINPQRNHYELVSLKQSELLTRIRQAAEIRNIVLWEMVGLNDIYVTVTAGPICAGKLGINKGEIIGYSLNYSYTDSKGNTKEENYNNVTGKAIGDAMVEEPNQPPPIQDIIGTMRWRMRIANR